MCNVVIVDDHQIVRSALQRLLKENLALVNVKMSTTYSELMEVLSQEPEIHLVILDINIPGGKKHLMIDEIRAVQKNVHILIFSGGLEDNLFALKYLKAGANGFISKSEPENLLLAAIHKVLSGGRYMSTAIQSQIVTDFLSRKRNTELEITLSKLTPREHDVLELLLLGKWTKEISGELNINRSTVSIHKSRIFDKFQVDNVLDLFRKNEVSGYTSLHSHGSF